MPTFSSQNGNLDPDLRMADPRAQSRYPSPFFDVSQQYIPPTVKELFKWCYFYCTNNSFLGPAIRKIAKYPVTDMVLEDESQELVKFWTTLLNNTLQIKTFNMEVNMDLTSYGNAFVSLHFPFSRLLECPSCRTRHPWKSINKKIDNLTVKIKCPKCKADGKAKIVDVPFKSLENVRPIRINPEFIDIKYNDATGRHTYLYNLPDRLKRQIMSGDPDIFEDTPLVYIESIKTRRKIKLNNQNLFHLKSPTLAGKDMGWGMPLLANALKDLYYFYTLRRAQEAIMNEHIIPFDIIFPQANGKMDPYVHTDLSSWRDEMKRQLAMRRRDPNYKAVLPFPVGFQRIGGDGKSMLLTPEMDFLAKTIIGTAGIPQEFVYGGSMQWSGSSISLRTLENDFLHHRSQLLQMDIWLVERIRLYLGVAAPKTIRFTDFKMADDMQKLSSMIQMAMTGKMPWHEVFLEMGRDPDAINKKLEEEAQFAAKLDEIRMLRGAESQAKGQIVQQKMMQREQQESMDVQNLGTDAITEAQVATWVSQLEKLPPEVQEVALRRLQMIDNTLKKLVENTMKANQVAAQEEQAQTAAMKVQGISPIKAKAAQITDAAGIPQPEPEQPAGKSGARPQPRPQQSQPQRPARISQPKPLPQQRPPRRAGGI